MLGSRFIFGILLSVIVSSSLYAAAFELRDALNQTLETRSWEKRVDEFERTIDYWFDSNLAVGCMGKGASVTARLSSDKSLMMIPILFSGARMAQSLSDGKFRFRIEDPALNFEDIWPKKLNFLGPSISARGIAEFDTSCTSYAEGEHYFNSCQVLVYNEFWEVLAQSKYARLETPEGIFDFKPDNTCRNILSGINEIAKDSLAVKNKWLEKQ